MFWLIRKIFWIGVLVAVVYYGSNYQIDGKPVKQYVREFIDSPLVQSLFKAGKEEVQELWEQQAGSKQPTDSKAPEASKSSTTHADHGDHLTEEDKAALDKVLEKQTK